MSRVTLRKALKYAEGHIAMVGVICTYVLTEYPSSPAAHIAAPIVGLLAALGVYKVRKQRRAK